MSLQNSVMEAMKMAMKNKDQVALKALRSIKSAILLVQSKGAKGNSLTEAEELKILHREAKQRKDSAAIFKERDRDDLAASELSELKIIEQFLPKAMNEVEIKKTIINVIKLINAEGMKDMGKVMGVVTKQLLGRADGRTISMLVKEELSK